MTCGHQLGAATTAGRKIDHALWANRPGGIDYVPQWLGWLAIPLSIVPLGALFIYAPWAYRRGRKEGVDREPLLDPYRNFGWRVAAWVGALLVPVLGLYALVHLPTLCYKQGLRVGARMSAAPTGFTSWPALGAAWGIAALAFFGPVVAGLLVSQDTMGTRGSPPGSAPVGRGFIRSTPSPFVPEAALGQPQWDISEVTRDGKKQTTLQDGTNLLLVGTTEARLPYSLEAWKLEFIIDTNGDGRQDAVVAHYSGGAHCCFEYNVFGSEDSGIQLYDTFNLGNSSLRAVEDLDGDTIPEMVALDDRLAYLSLDVSYAASPFLPLVLCRSAEGKYDECTPRFPELLMQSAEDFEGRLRDAISEGAGGDPWAVEHQRAAALGLLASYLRLGQAEEGWMRVQAACPECSDWLQANLGALQERLSP
jgi:hypothetical protein